MIPELLPFYPYKGSDKIPHNINAEVYLQLIASIEPQEGDLRLYIIVDKLKQELSVFAGTTLKVGLEKKVATFAFTAMSGTAGPKVRNNDGQIPEGFYYITHFNPDSKYHLSLRINYPNSCDLRRNSTDPGGDIYIHGGESSAGCIAIGNENMERLYVMVQVAKYFGQERVGVTIV